MNQLKVLVSILAIMTSLIIWFYSDHDVNSLRNSKVTELSKRVHVEEDFQNKGKCVFIYNIASDICNPCLFNINEYMEISEKMINVYNVVSVNENEYNSLKRLVMSSGVNVDTIIVEEQNTNNKPEIHFINTAENLLFAKLRIQEGYITNRKRKRDILDEVLSAKKSAC